MSTDLLQISDQARSIERAIVLWLDEKGGKSQSRGTRRKYERNVSSFRALLQHAGLDLDADRHIIQMAAQGWAAQRWRGDDQAETISNATYNQRIASLSSFYEFCIKRECVQGIERNPLLALDRRKTDDYLDAQPMCAEDEAEHLE